MASWDGGASWPVDSAARMLVLGGNDGHHALPRAGYWRGRATHSFHLGTASIDAAAENADFSTFLFTGLLGIGIQTVTAHRPPRP